MSRGVRLRSPLLFAAINRGGSSSSDSYRPVVLLKFSKTAQLSRAQPASAATDQPPTSPDVTASPDVRRAENQAGTSYQQSLSVGTDADYFLVRAVNCGGNGTCNSGGLGQADDRDAGIASSGTCE